MTQVVGQIGIFDGADPLKIVKPIRLIELFAGIGAQARALEKLGVQFEHYRICEFDKSAVLSYNAVHGTNFETSDITKIHADDLGVCDTNQYCYIMTYSFPCTDLSVAGKQSGMKRGGGTRSGLLWEVERLLKEMKELPQILLMENVPAVVSDKFIKDFAEWLEFLDSIGYQSKYSILNAKDYGIPQNRERCFMISWRGDYYYEFPRPTPLKLRLKDMLEESVGEGYYLSEERVSKILMYQRPSDVLVEDRMEDMSGTSCVLMSRNEIGKRTDVAATLMARDYKGFGNQMTNGVVESGGGGITNPEIIVAGTLNPDKPIQDRVRVLSDEGICQGLRATDYKDPPKLYVGGADGIYTQVSDSFQRGPLKDVSRTLKASSHDAGVILYGD